MINRLDGSSTSERSTSVQRSTSKRSHLDDPADAQKEQKKEPAHKKQRQVQS
jgi:hypothetical protein